MRYEARGLGVGVEETVAGELVVRQLCADGLLVAPATWAAGEGGCVLRQGLRGARRGG